MSNITYDRNKVDAFKSAFANYQTANTSFKAKMEQFREVIEFMEGTSITLAPQQESITGGEGYVINEKGILIQTPNTNDYDSSVNSVVDVGGYKAFVTDVEYQAGNVASVAKTNKLYQVGLEDLEYNQAAENVIVGDARYVYAGDSPTISDGNNCGMNHLSQCSARAKMENKSYYGIEGGTDLDTTSICNCYTFNDNELPNDTVGERLKQITIDDDDDSETAYLAILMDGNFYQIKESTFSNNYSGFYEYVGSDSKITSLINGGKDAILNPFVGDGINTIKITELGENTCLGLN